MAPRKRHGVGRVKGSITFPPTSTHVVNTRGFAALADEIYLELVSHIPSVPIPTSIHLKSYPEIRRSRHETFLSLSQTSRSLRRFFWRYLWQHIEVREGMKIGDEDDTEYLSDSADTKGHKKYAVELVRQLEIVTVRNPQLAQYVNCLDIFIGQYSIETVLAELARCLSLFSNLHTVQIDVLSKSRRGRSFEEIFEQTFEKYSYPQIRNVFIMHSSVSFVASCPQARRVGFTRHLSMSIPCLRTIVSNCSHLEILEGGGIFCLPYACKLVVDNLANLRTIQFRIFPIIEGDGDISNINILKNLNHLRTIIIWTPPVAIDWLNMHMPRHEQSARTDKVVKDWVESAKHILIQIQLRDNLEKTVVVRDYDGNERRILIKPKSPLSTLKKLEVT